MATHKLIRSICSRRKLHAYTLYMMLVGVLAFALPGQAKPPPIILGQSTALSGPAKDLGREMQAGLRAAFAFTNDNGGVKGREVHLLSLDDGYEPDQAVRNTLELINDEQAFLLIGEVGTPTSKAVIPIIEEYKIPFFAPFTGAELLRTPFRRYVINIRASYYQEMEEIASYLVDQRGLEKIACFYQNDSYGFAGLQGIEKALRKRGMQLVSKGSYERNTLAVMGALHDIRKANPEAIVMVGAYPACAEFIKLSKTKLRQNLVFASISFVGTESLKDALGAYGENVFVSQVVPDPLNPSIPLVNEYRKSMQKYQYDAPISFVSLEGYIAGKLFASIATSVKGELTREMFITTMEQHGTFDLGGIVLTFGPRDHQGLDTIHLTRIYPQIAPLSATLPTSATHPLFPDLVSR